MIPVDVISGDSPVILGQPHGGTYVPQDILGQLNDQGKGLDDTDWHITRLYDGLLENVSVVKATFHRYVIDANRDPAGHSLYPGQNTTSLCPTTDFDGNPIWKMGMEPSIDEIERRRGAFHEPYHAALESEIERVKTIHGFAILYDCHSIRSEIDFLFDGLLPVFSIGTNEGKTCADSVEQTTLRICENASNFDHVINGRFKGGWTTRQYGQPENNVHAIQMELAQRTYMNEHAPWAYRPDLAENIRPHLAEIIQSLSDLALS